MSFFSKDLRVRNLSRELHRILKTLFLSIAPLVWGITKVNMRSHRTGLAAEFLIDTLNTMYMQQYIHDLADEMGDDLDNMVSAFKFFNSYGKTFRLAENIFGLEFLQECRRCNTNSAAIRILHSICLRSPHSSRQ